MSAIPTYRADCCCTYRWFARASAVILFAFWLAAVVWEGVPDHGVTLPLAAQLSLLAVIFGGYALAVRHELAGAIVSLTGIAAFVITCLTLLDAAPTLPFAWFALPPILSLVAWEMHRKEHPQPPHGDGI